MPRKITRRQLLTGAAPLAASSLIPGAAQSAVASAFYHGVASGDPTQEAIILWSRITTSMRKLEVRWQLAADREFSRVVKEGMLLARAESDHTLKVDVDGLQPGRDYYYRFISGDIVSPIGRTKTLPGGEVSEFRLGVCSCSNFPAGYFHAYREMANRKDLDVVVHLGDYIYEYDADGYASAGAASLGRTSSPQNELIDLHDFRQRHAQYKGDKNLQALHASVPFILSWDDHEFADNAWHSGARNHNEGEGEWLTRQQAALQAYYEWMPIREPDNGRRLEQWRSFEIGDLGTLIMLETRVSARDEQVEVAEQMRFEQISFADKADGSTETYNVPYDVNTEPATRITEYQRVKELAELERLPDGIVYSPDIQAFNREVLDDPDRQLLGAAQREFVANAISKSTAAGKPWQIVGNQTLVAEVKLPNLVDKLSKQEQSQMADWMKPVLPLTRLGLPFGTDSWNGYGAEREAFLKQAAEQDAGLIVLTGDTHAAWLFDLQTNAVPDWHGIELGTTSITSPGLPEALGVPAERLEELLIEDNANLSYSETAHKGYLTLTLTAQSASSEFHRIDSITAAQYQRAGSDRFSFTRAESGGIAGIPDATEQPN